MLFWVVWDDITANPELVFYSLECDSRRNNKIEQQQSHLQLNRTTSISIQWNWPLFVVAFQDPLWASNVTQIATMQHC